MRFLVTAGPTHEYLDTVRFISNASSGKMGFAIAAQAQARGHQVVLVAGPVQLARPNGVEYVGVQSAAEMLEAAVAAFESSHIAIMAAAVCDFRPARRFARKIAKQELAATIGIESTEDICAHLGSIKGRRVVLGFALEDHNHQTHAEEKLRRKRCDAIVMNNSSNLGSDWAEVRVLRADTGWQPAISGTKEEIARALVELAEAIASAHGLP